MPEQSKYFDSLRSDHSPIQFHVSTLVCNRWSLHGIFSCTNSVTNIQCRLTYQLRQTSHRIYRLQTSSRAFIIFTNTRTRVDTASRDHGPIYAGAVRQGVPALILDVVLVLSTAASYTFATF